MEFSPRASIAAENEQRNATWAKASQHRPPTVLQSNLKCLDEEWGKKSGQWSDCSPYTSNPTISDPYMSCATTGRRLGLPHGRQPQRHEGTVVSGTRIPQSRRRCYHFSSLSVHQTKKGMSRAASHLSHLFREPKASSVICFLLFCPTTCLLLENKLRLPAPWCFHFLHMIEWSLISIPRNSVVPLQNLLGESLRLQERHVVIFATLERKWKFILHHYSD